jgi:hypothetical protein
MTMTDDRMTERELETLLEGARDTGPQPDAAWMARVAEDAARMQRRRPVSQSSLWLQLRAALGGWQGMGGLAVACAVGLWLGVAPPAPLGDPVARIVTGSQAVDLVISDMFDLALLLEEG